MTFDELAAALHKLGWRQLDQHGWIEWRARDGTTAIAWSPLDDGPEPLATLFPDVDGPCGRVPPADALQWAQALGSGRAGSA